MEQKTKATEPIWRAGIIGLGFIGGGDQVSGDALGQQVSHLDGTHVEALSRNKRIQLVAGSSRDAGRRERFAQSTGCKTYADWRQMLARERLDMVSVATYAPVHAEMTVACAEHGVRAVYCEKPIATRLADAERMVSACAKAGVLLVLNHNRRFNPNYRRLRDLIAEGRLGDLTSGSLRWGAGRLGNVGTHLVDAACMLTGRSVRAVSGILDLSHKPDCRGPEFHDPGGFGWIQLDGGLMMAVDAADYGKGKHCFILNGTLGRAITGGPDVTLEFWDGSSDHWPSPQGAPTSMDRAVGEIVDALEGRAPFPCEAMQSVRTLETLIAFHASHAHHGAWVALPLKNGERDIELQTA